MTTLKITVGKARSLKERARDRILSAEAGEELEEIDPVLNFSDYSDLDRLLSEKNLELIEAIREDEPTSMRKAAKLVNRDFKEVHRNLTELEALGIIEFEEEGRAKKPVVPFDDIQISIDLRDTFSNRDTDPVTILVVDDEQSVADAYAAMLEDDYEVRTAYSGEEALELFDERVDIVFLDRRMPDLSGDKVLEEIRNRSGQSKVVMVSAVDPDFDILEMDFDAYLTKPVTPDHLKDTIIDLQARSNYREEIQQLWSLETKRDIIESVKSSDELMNNEVYQELRSKISELKSQISESDLRKVS